MRVVWWIFGALLLIVQPLAAQDVRPLNLSQQSYIRSDRLGITFVAYLNNLGVDADVRYRQALEMGAGWTRYPIYWNAVETSPSVFQWDGYDRLVDADRAAGLKTNAILLGVPPAYGDSTNISGLYAPTFSDGSDQLGAGKSINPSNVWARYVYETVNRYRPGGVLATQRRWLPTEGIRVWEMWNEPDLAMFWQGTAQDYARLLQVGYLAAKQADPNAQVMFGGLAYGNPDTRDFLREVLLIQQADPNRSAYNNYFDLLGLHSYTEARRTGLVISRVRDTLAAFGVPRPIWLNETGIPVWDDYPGPTWAANDPAARRLRGTQEQQAAFVLQSAAYAFAAGADKVFFHQLYDDCGDSGGDFAPDSGQAGDAYGFYRNPTYADCFSQHPQPATPRPSVGAFKTLAGTLGRGELGESSIVVQDGVVFVRFTRPNGERTSVFWNARAINSTPTWEAQSTSATVYAYNMQAFGLVPTGGVYTATLTPARVNDDPQQAPGQGILIGGQTFVMVERVALELANLGAPSLPAVVTPRAPLPAQIGSILGGANVPLTVGEPVADITPPITGMEQLPPNSPPTFTVRWNAADTGGIAKYRVWVRVNGGEWQAWIETSRTSADYNGMAGNTYDFAVWAQDNAGNWSLNTVLEAQASTQVTLP